MQGVIEVKVELMISSFSEASIHVTRKQSLHVPQEMVMREFCSKN